MRNSELIVRPITPADRDIWLRMRCDLWPDDVAAHAREIDAYFDGRMYEPLEVLIACDSSGEPLGFAELNIRNCVDGCSTDRVGYLEGWYVVPQARRCGVGAALVRAAENWARARGCTFSIGSSD